jgi:hypothetical protein
MVISNNRSFIVEVILRVATAYDGPLFTQRWYQAYAFEVVPEYAERVPTKNGKTQGS